MLEENKTVIGKKLRLKKEREKEDKINEMRRRPKRMGFLGSSKKKLLLQMPVKYMHNFFQNAKKKKSMISV